MNQLQEQQQPQQQIKTQIFAAQQTISGPVPSPEVLGAYEQMSPGAAKIILDMALKDQEVEHELRRALQATIERDNLAERAAEKRGQWLAFTLVCLSIGASVVLTYMGNKIAGWVLAGAPLATIATKIITRK
ncbi:MAG: DUF2335 domain-containing protein [Deltaproteobacteria bacterium]|nr:DUF2335 domain-containing protein [Deltaproteobacteria bacterium]